MEQEAERHDTEEKVNEEGKSWACPRGSKRCRRSEGGSIMAVEARENTGCRRKSRSN